MLETVSKCREIWGKYVSRNWTVLNRDAQDVYIRSESISGSGEGFLMDLMNLIGGLLISTKAVKMTDIGYFSQIINSAFHSIQQKM